MTIEIGIGWGTCNGEEAKFAEWLNRNDDITAWVDNASETTVNGDRDHDLSNDLWDAYCRDDESLRDDLIITAIKFKSE